MAQHDRSSRRVKTVDTVYDILETTKRLDGATVSEIADELDLAYSTVYEHLRSLAYRGYVREEDGAYHLGLKFLDYGTDARKSHPVYEVAEPRLSRFAEKTPEVSWLLCVEEFGSSVVLMREMGERAVETSSGIGQSVPMHAVASGKAMLAHMPEEQVEEILDDHGLAAITDDTITEREQLEEELSKIRKRGFARSDCELFENIRSVAAAVITEDQVHGSVVVSGPKYRINDEEFETTYPEKVLAAKNELELTMTQNDIDFDMAEYGEDLR